MELISANRQFYSEALIDVTGVKYIFMLQLLSLVGVYYELKINVHI